MREWELPDLLKKERSSPVLSGLTALPSENELFLLNYRKGVKFNYNYRLNQKRTTELECKTM